ncbi:MAG: PAS domain S-box protein [Selenomonadales bacterium]|nr:PAS domain S-box protein [Selenomonadales bacterium]
MRERKLEAALRQTQLTLDMIINTVPGFVYRCANDPQWTMSYLSEGFTAITGYAQEALIDNKQLAYNDIIHPEHRDWVGAQTRLTLGLPLEVEYRIVTASGEVRWVWDRGKAVFEEDGRVAYLEGFVTDITKRKLVEIELANREEQYRHLFELSPDKIVVLDLEGNIMDANEAYYKASGYTRAELIGANVRLFVPADHQHLVAGHLARIAAGETLVHEVYSLERSGEVRRKLLRERAIPLGGGRRGVLSIATDIEDQRQLIESLHQGEKRYRSLVESLLEGMAIVRADGEVVFWNPSAAKMFGVSEPTGSAVGKAQRFLHPASGESARQDFVSILEGTKVTAEYHCLRVDGSTMWLEIYGTLIDYEGEAAMLLLMRDVTERRSVQEAREYLYWHDSLTGLYNRHYFEKLLSEGSMPSPAIIVADLNGLKLINDTFGHVAGDELLKSVARLLEQNAPDGAVCARIGGDEFVILIPDARSEDVAQCVLQLEGAIVECNNTTPHYPFSVSFGYKTATEFGGGVYALYKEADDHMYREKLLQKQSSRSSLVHVLMGALESKNFETREHVERMGELAVTLARAIEYPEDAMFELVLFAKFHDIGKVGVADSILQKPGPLNPEEKKEMQRHCEIGYRIAMASPELATVADLILKHHEWWNGAGYPHGLSRHDIPLACRIVAIADAFDAMTSDRPYRQGMSSQDAILELQRYAGTQFDPMLVEVLVETVRGEMSLRDGRLCEKS